MFTNIIQNSNPKIKVNIHPGSIELSPTTAYIICVFGLFYYIFAISLFFLYIGPCLREKYGKKFTLKFWEIFISIAWQIQTIGFTSLTLIANLPYFDSFDFIPKWVTTVIGISFVVAGIKF